MARPRTPESPRRSSTFNKEQIEELRKILGATVLQQLLPELELLVRYAAPLLREADRRGQRHRELALKYAAAAAKLERHARRIRPVLASLDQLLDDASSEWYMPHPRLRGIKLSDLVHGGRALSRPSVFSALRLELAEAVSFAQKWRIQADEGRRGRKDGGRRAFAVGVGEALAAEGLKFGKSGCGVFAEVLRVVYKAAALTAPVELFDDVAYAVAELTQRGLYPPKKQVRKS